MPEMNHFESTVAIERTRIADSVRKKIIETSTTILDISAYIWMILLWDWRGGGWTNCGWTHTERPSSSGLGAPVWWSTDIELNWIRLADSLWFRSRINMKNGGKRNIQKKILEFEWTDTLPIHLWQRDRRHSGRVPGPLFVLRIQ